MFHILDVKRFIALTVDFFIDSKQHDEGFCETEIQKQKTRQDKEEYVMITDDDKATLHKTVVEKYRRGQISIRVNRSSSLLLYPSISENPLVKVFNFIVRVYSFPLTIIGVIFGSVFTDNYLLVLCYIIGLFCLISAEDYLSEVTTIHSVLTNQKVFSNLQRRGVIYIRDIVDPEVPV